MSKKIKKDDNFLELVPKIKEGQDWVEDERGLVKIIIVRDGILEKIIRPFLKTPRTMKIDLDKLGSLVWKSIDGLRTIEEIGLIVKDEFGEDAEPLYERLAAYVNILRNNKFISIEK